MKPCPKCGNYEYRESRQCPEYGGEGVCIRCCRECQYYNPEMFGPRCTYHIKNPKINWTEEIIKVQQKIVHTEAKIRRLYELNWPKKAERLEIDLKALIAEKRKLEEKRDEEIKSTRHEV